jgi:tetratricopeptide (TPR) repeat protein
MTVPHGATSLLLAALLTPLGGPAHRKTESGNDHYLAGDLDLALAQYTEAQVAAPDAAELHYDIGNVLYRQADYAGAAEAYERALATANPALRPFAAYNLGNARFQQKEYSKAAESYRRALEEVPSDADAKRNLELALRALEQQSKSESKPDSNKDKDKDKDKDSKQDEQQQQQQQKDDGKGPGPSPSPSAEPQGGDSKPKKPQPSPRPGAGQMTPDQAARLLDGAADSERDAKKKEAERLAHGGDAAREKDW